MVIPLGGGGMGGGLNMDEQEAPDVVKQSHSKVWMALIGVFALTTIGRFVGGDILGGFLVLIMAIYCYFMIRKDCSQMNQCCLLSFGFICLIQFVFEVIPLFSAVGGRSMQHQTMAPAEGSKTTYTVTVERHAFIDPAMTWRYNLQSIMMIVAPLAMLCGAVLCYFTYNAFPTSIFAQDESSESQPIGGGRQGGGSGFGSLFGGGGGQQQQQQEQSSGGGRAVGRAAQPQQTLFSGSGQRLGS